MDTSTRDVIDEAVGKVEAGGEIEGAGEGAGGIEGTGEGAYEVAVTNEGTDEVTDEHTGKTVSVGELPVESEIGGDAAGAGVDAIGRFLESTHEGEGEAESAVEVDIVVECED
ncbi:hypothetical protein OHB35_11640 [Streptomyces phaeochromogenes]|uniref:Uncharacterized protein n=1 Tax=Streptomyces phaeochromogenes TaxID=1923 RepID=A0ABZ1H9E9_STRPH|nr:hypothetical protein [Streptomyces phaeochromogenes]WSD13834.1 hypothetical protein OHB35_11640 [Streptomyces phaeochromogenes]